MSKIREYFKSLGCSVFHIWSPSAEMNPVEFHQHVLFQAVDAIDVFSIDYNGNFWRHNGSGINKEIKNHFQNVGYKISVGWNGILSTNAIDGYWFEISTQVFAHSRTAKICVMQKSLGKAYKTIIDV